VAHLHAVPSGPDDDDDHVVDAEDSEAGGATIEPDREPVDADEPADDAVESGVEERRYPSTIGGAFYLSILAVSCVAIVIAVRSDWRLGVQILGGALMVGALLRLTLAPKDAGMLAVRNRFLDAILLGGLGIGLVVLATSIPNMPT
jgi:hypothetical protein